MTDIIRLEIQIDDKGTPSLRYVTQSLEDLGKKAAGAAPGMLKLNAAGREMEGVFQGIARDGASLLGRFGGLVMALGPLGVGIGATAFAAYKSVNAFTDLAIRVRDLSYISGGSVRDVNVLRAGLEAMGTGHPHDVVRHRDRLSRPQSTPHQHERRQRRPEDRSADFLRNHRRPPRSDQRDRAEQTLPGSLR
jgi:hypothetical protein